MQLTNDYWITMYVLYSLAALFFGLSYISYKIHKKVLSNAALTIGLFFNPFGYDWVVFGMNYLTKDYWMTMSIMYMLAGTFFGLFVYFYNINLVRAFSYHAKKTHRHIKTKIKKNG
jgi:hypothetical protein